MVDVHAPPLPNQRAPPGVFSSSSSSLQESGTEAAAGTTTLLVKHLPDALPLETLKRLFSHYGASDIRPCVAAKMKNCAFVDFKEEAYAARAQSQLHRLRFLGKILAVERAKPKVPKGSNKEQSHHPLSSSAHPQANILETQREAQRLPYSTGHFEKGITGGGPRSEPIAPSLGVDYPFPPHLEYAYPPPDGNILTNIVNALIAVPRFYTQVLHLMNKMNLPAPFRPALPTPPLPPPPPEPAAPAYPDRELSSDESEIESSEEKGTSLAGGGMEVSGNDNRASKKRKAMVEDSREAITTALVPKEKALIKKKRPVLHINIKSKGQSKEKKQEQPKEKEQEQPKEKEQRLPEPPSHEPEATDQLGKEESKELRNTISREELIAGRMPANELFALPVYKNYTRGNPTQVLYIKNLAKDVTKEDLHFVFGAIFDKSEELKPQLGIKLMQEGRMRGQAFVTFPSTELAEDALNIVHGFLLKGKPMVAQFGRNPVVAKATE